MAKNDVPVTADGTTKKKGKKWWIWLIVLAVIVGIVLALLGLGRRASQAMQEMTAYTEEEVTAHDVVKVLTGSGTLQPADSYTVNTLVEGDVIFADFEEGDMVEKDTVLYRIDSSDSSTNIERAELSLNQARRSYHNAADKQYVRTSSSGTIDTLYVEEGDDVTPGEVIATVRDSSVLTLTVPFPADDADGFFVGQAAEVTLDGTFEKLGGTVKTVSGTRTVGAGNVITRRVTVEVRNPGALTAEQSATATIAGVGCAGSGKFTYHAESTVTAPAGGTVSELRVREGDAVGKDQIIATLWGDDLSDSLQNASDSLRSAELSLESSQKQLDHYTITSPISGTIVDKTAKNGDKVSQGNQLCVIYDMSHLEMTINIDELDIRSVSVGQSVAITADAVAGAAYEGVITKVSVAGTTSGGVTSYPVTVRIDETEGLLPGMNVDAEISVARADGVLAVPNEAVERGNLVLITENSPSAANADEREAPEGYVYVQVKTGTNDDDYIEITEGLQSGDIIAYYPDAPMDSLQRFMQNMSNGGGMGGGMGGHPGMGGGPGN